MGRRRKCMCLPCRKDRKRDRLRAAEEYIERRLEGLCGHCGKNPSAPDRRQCDTCLADQKERMKSRRALQRRKRSAKTTDGVLHAS